MAHSVIRCFHRPKKIMIIGGISYYSSDEDGVMDFNGDVVINLTKSKNLPIAALYPELYKHIEMPFNEVMIPWPDFGLPLVKLSFWAALQKVAKHKKWKKVCIQCGHGHGRTGTALSALLIANMDFEPLEAVNFVRQHHCEESVETMEQCRYLMEVDMHYNKRQPLDKNLPEPAMMTNWDYESINTSGVNKPDED